MRTQISIELVRDGLQRWSFQDLTIDPRKAHLFSMAANLLCDKCGTNDGATVTVAALWRWMIRHIISVHGMTQIGY